MKIKEKESNLFLSAMQNLSLAIKNESLNCGKLCGGINEKELLVINYIGQNKNVTMSDIADNLDAPLSTLTNIVDKLVERKFLSRKHGGADRRVINVKLAKNGQTAYGMVCARKKHFTEKLLSRFIEKDRATFIGHVNILASAIVEVE